MVLVVVLPLSHRRCRALADAIIVVGSITSSWSKLPQVSPGPFVLWISSSVCTTPVAVIIESPVIQGRSIVSELDSDPGKARSQREAVKGPVQLVRENASCTARDVLQRAEAALPNGLGERQEHFSKRGRRVARAAHQLQRDETDWQHLAKPLSCMKGIF